MSAISLPSSIERAIELELADDRSSRQRRVAALRELFVLFTQERARLGRLSYLDDPGLRGAYLRYHLPLNLARAACALAETLRAHPALSELRRVVDFGAGLGSASLATLAGLPPAPREFILFDRSQAALQGAARLLAASAPAGAQPVVTTQKLLLPRLPRSLGKALVWLAMVLNELAPNRKGGAAASDLLESLADRLEEGSVLIVVEPALRGPGRQLLRLHDDALESGRWRALAPCTHQRSCPLLATRDRSWCHFHFSWSAPPIVREVAEPLGLEHARPALAYLALERTGRRRKASRGDDDRARARVVSDPMRAERGEHCLYVCRDGKRETLFLTAREIESASGRSPLARGDILELEGGRILRRAPFLGR